MAAIVPATPEPALAESDERSVAEASCCDAASARESADGACEGDEAIQKEGCRQRMPRFSGDNESLASTAVEAPAAENTDTPEEVQPGSLADDEEYNQFVFPIALDTKCLRAERGAGAESESEEDEDTDAPVVEDGFVNKIANAKMFTDPEEREKWKNRGWRAVQCCGGALLVLALIFDEMD
eukprot:TRINITY_DN20674_c0_g2_i1.p1 TRINITY_DN20674_c0_g2~~TRINITY_DN20674_c0_g2_i1.p1  ORF type:complete len:182 (+),score=46.55 TRINITY_DN20674_c0_g2_i1:74-619(+)